MSLTATAGIALAENPAGPAERSTSAVVHLFDAKKSGRIDVRLILKDSKSGTLIIANNMQAPLTVKMPEAFAGVPVLAQRGGRGGGIGGNIGGNGSGGSQGIGGGLGGGGVGGGGFGGGGFGGGGGLFNIGPERVTKLKFVAVCLEHGKEEPSARVPYDLVPISNLTSNPRVVQVVSMLGRGEINQSAAQAAAWHLANGLSWQQLADKIGVKHINGTAEPYFSRLDLETAQQIAAQAAHRASLEITTVQSPGELSLFRRH
jgi:hypothetical protein